MRKLLTSSPLVVLSVPVSVYKHKPVILNRARGSMHYALAAALKPFEFCRPMMNIKAFIGTVALGLTMAVGEITAVSAAVALPIVEHVGNSATLAPVLEKVLPAVVSILVESRAPEGLGSTTQNRRDKRSRSHVAAERNENRAGSGVVFDAPRGLIITNNHVIDRADKITVILSNGRQLQANIVGSDPATDVAVIKVPPDDLTAIIYGDSDHIRVGDFVLAIGNPSSIGESVTYGIIGGLHRTGLGVEQYEDFIQTDAGIYPGSSGGALVDLQGKLVGINTAYIGASNGNPGLGFAIPINMARKVAEQIVEFGNVRRGKFGMSYTPAIVRDTKRMPLDALPIISRIDAGSTAERAGLKSGDAVTEVDGTPVRDAADLRNRLGLLWIGESTEFSVLRSGKAMTIRVTITDNKRSGRTN
jgi:serine protease DegQ